MIGGGEVRHLCQALPGRYRLARESRVRGEGITDALLEATIKPGVMQAQHPQGDPLRSERGQEEWRQVHNRSRGQGTEASLGGGQSGLCI